MKLTPSESDEPDSSDISVPLQVIDKTALIASALSIFVVSL